MDNIDETIRFSLIDFKRTVLPSVRSSLVRRELSLGSPLAPKVGNLVKTVTGMRRCGKTFRLYQEILALMDTGIDESRICYFNFDDDRIRPYPADVIDRVLELFFEMNPGARSRGAYLFFDEIQDVPNWDAAARRIVDTEKVTMYLTGSSSRLLSEDIATEFRGRSLSYELAPYSFSEYVQAAFGMRPGDIEGQALENKETVSYLKNAFARYLKEGGFPGLMGLEDLERIQTLQSYVQLTVARDIVERRKFSNAAYVRDLARYAVASSARDFSLSKIDHRSKSRGYSPGRETIARMLDAFEDAHLAYGLYDFSRSAIRSRLRGYKVYAVDTGLMSALAPATTDGLARALETFVYLGLRRRRFTGRAGEISMLKLKSGREVDFAWGDEGFDVAYSLVQVSVSVREERTRKRELAALDEALALFPDASAAVVTMDETGNETLENGRVRIIPAWKWALENKR